MLILKNGMTTNHILQCIQNKPYLIIRFNIIYIYINLYIYI